MDECTRFEGGGELMPLSSILIAEGCTRSVRTALNSSANFSEGPSRQEFRESQNSWAGPPTPGVLPSVLPQLSSPIARPCLS